MTEENFLNVSKLRDILLKNIYYWKFFLISFLVCILISLVYLRYSTYKYKIDTKIQIIDKAQESDMALPTAMTIFNRSMVNLENEIGVLKSFRIHKEVVKNLKSNIFYLSEGLIKNSQNHPNDWFNDYDLEFLAETDTINNYSKFEFSFENDGMTILTYDKDGNAIKEQKFNSYSTFNIKHGLPFNIKINDELSEITDFKKSLVFHPFEYIVESFRSSVTILESGKDSDQLDILMYHSNKSIGEEYLNTLTSEFDKDGIFDRQLEHKRTIEFVDSRSYFLEKELENIEERKRAYKKNNNLTNIENDATLNISQQYNYDSELFTAETELAVLNMLSESLIENKSRLMPINVGVQDESLNLLISEFNLAIREKNRFMMSAGENNPFIQNLNQTILNYSNNILESINNYKNSLTISITDLKNKENEFELIYKNIPESEKVLRSINRELEIKEALFLLLLQKKEEASINFAVVKPSIKIIDSARSSIKPVSPLKELVVLIGALVGLFIPFIIIYIMQSLDNKVHTKDQVQDIVGSGIPIIGEIPFINDKNSLNKIFSSASRSVITESFRILISNLNFTLFNNEKKSNEKVILVTSTIKGEGKTIVSVNLAANLSLNNSRVLLLGSDLRNPQIHKFLGVDKNVPGLSDLIVNEDLDWQDIKIKSNNIDIIVSGKIPPNPTELLSSNRFKQLVNLFRKNYDYIVVDSAPCLLVSDTFQISKIVDSTIYVVRSNFTENKLVKYIDDSNNQNKFNGLNIVINSVGSSNSYSYAYKYGYGYGYKYGYNYGYGYGYGSNKN